VPPEPLSRRSFLALAGGATLLAACSSSKNSGLAPSSTSIDPNSLTTGIVSSDLYASPRPQRLAFVVDKQNGNFASTAPAHVAIKPPQGELGPYTVAPLHSEGLPENRGVYVMAPVLARPGIWTAEVQTAGQQLEMVFQVNAQPSAPTIGAMAPRVASPTQSRPLGVNPLCTRNPQCPLHTTSLSTLIGKGRPTAVIFATPALCKLKYCGPVLDMYLPIAHEFASQVDSVHVEIYADKTGTTLSPTVTAWKLPSEPWLFGVDPSGRITARLDGAFAADEARQVLAELARA
jgi:hypothetical protein